MFLCRTLGTIARSSIHTRKNQPFSYIVLHSIRTTLSSIRGADRPPAKCDRMTVPAQSLILICYLPGAVFSFPADTVHYHMFQKATSVIRGFLQLTFVSLEKVKYENISSAPLAIFNLVRYNTLQPCALDSTVPSTTHSISNGGLRRGRGCREHLSPHHRDIQARPRTQPNQRSPHQDNPFKAHYRETQVRKLEHRHAHYKDRGPQASRRGTGLRDGRRMLQGH